MCGGGGGHVRLDDAAGRQQRRRRAAAARLRLPHAGAGITLSGRRGLAAWMTVRVNKQAARLHLQLYGRDTC
jgi:hypothetical protein